MGQLITGRAMFARHHLLLVCMVVGVVVCAPSTAAVFEPREFASALDEQRYKQLNAELRCLVCQNQSIAESDAPLAQDLRREVFRMLNEGRSDEQITDFMVQRYGDFVLYRPPIKASTLALWVAPLALMIIGLLVLWRVLKRQRIETAAQAPLSAEQQQRLAKFVANNDSGANH